MRGATKLFRIFGIDIKLHFSWWFVFFFLIWVLSSSVFPEISPAQSTLTYWFMGTIAAILLFVSVLLHELSHSLVAKARNIKVESITLFFFGGVAGITKEEMKPSSEFLMAIAGPLFSLFLFGLFFVLHLFLTNVIWMGILSYLYQINLILAIFNMIPGFPLDGGRAFRAILYWYYKDLKKATRIAAMGGKFFAGFLIIIGILGLFSGTGGGLWFILLGGFLYFIANISNEQVVVRDVLGKIPVKDLITKDYVTLNPQMKFKDFVKKYLKTEEDIFLVKDKKYAGLLSLGNIEQILPKLQDLLMLKQIAVPLSKIKSLKVSDDAYMAFRYFSKFNIDVLPVIENKRFLGVVTRKQVIRRLVWNFKFSAGKTAKKSKTNKK